MYPRSSSGSSDTRRGSHRMCFVDSSINQSVCIVFAQWRKATASKHGWTQYLKVCIRCQNSLHSFCSPPLKSSSRLVGLRRTQIRTLRLNVKGLRARLCQYLLQRIHQGPHIIPLLEESVVPA